MSEFNFKKKYYKVIKAGMVHYDHTYTEGLNILQGEFNSNPEASCEPGGFYFTDKERISKFYKYGDNVWEVRIPKDAQVVKDLQGDKWRTDKIILKKKHDKIEFISKLPKHLKCGLVLKGCNIPKGLVLPKRVGAYLNLSGCNIPEGILFPKSIGGSLDLRGCTLPQGLVLPEIIGGSLYLSGCNIPEGIIFPKSIEGSLGLSGCTLTKGLVLPKSIGASLNLSGCTLPKGLVLPKSIGSWLDLSGCEGHVPLSMVKGEIYR